jgi:hypothetical protein
VIVLTFAAAGVPSQRHADKLMSHDDASDKPVWPWVVAGIALLGIASGVAAVEISTRPRD